jgi:integrase
MPTPNKPRRLKFTQAAIARLKPSDDGKATTYWDLNLPGFGCRVSPRGRLTWIAQYRVRYAGKDSKDLEVVETLGTTDKVLLSEAQQQARASFTKARMGVHPVQIRRRAVAAQHRKQQQDSFTFRLLANRYMREYVLLNNKPSSAKEARRLLDRACLCQISPSGIFGDLSVSAITPQDIDALLAAQQPQKRYQQSATRGLIEANSILGAVRRAFRWAKQMHLVEVNPSADRPMPLRKVPTRDRVLDDDEIIKFWQGCESVGWPFGQLFRLLLLTGQRLNECAGMTWAEIDLDNCSWNLPAERTKNGRQHEVALSDMAMEIITGLPRFVDDNFVFPSTDPTKPVSGFVHAKQRVLDHMASPTPWRLHDLRRTATTGMARLGVPPHVADRVLNHQSGTISGVAAVYNRFQYLDERHDALQKWGEFVGRLVGANVVAMQAR